MKTRRNSDFGALESRFTSEPQGMLLRPLQRCFTRSLYRRHFSSSSSSIASKQPRFYRYAVDVHGGLFLHDTTPKNLTSCFKNPQFLDFFYARVRPNKISPEHEGKPSEEDLKLIGDPEWTENEDLSEQDAIRLAALDGYKWVSPCQGELNFIRATESPIVFRELDEEGNLLWAGSYTSRFDPSSLKVDPETGYVFHPSPLPPLKSARKRVEENGPKSNPYGQYSLLSSALVLQRLATGLDIDADAFCQGIGGSIEWKGERWDMGVLSQ